MGVLVGRVIGGAKVKMASRELEEIDDSYCITLDQLPYLCLVNICDFLAPEDVAKFGSVCKTFRDAARSEGIWRRYALERWAFCDISRMKDESSKWFNYYRARRHVENKMDHGRPTRDYKVKSLRDHKTDIISSFCLDGERVATPLLVTLSLDSIVNVWNISEAKLVHSISDKPVTCITENDDASRVVTGDRLGGITLYDTTDWSIIATTTDNGVVNDIAINKLKSQFLLLAIFCLETSNDVIKVWNISKLEETLFTITLTSLSTPNLSMSNGHWFGIYDNSNNDLLLWNLSELCTTTDPHITIHRQSTGPVLWYNTDTIMTSGSTGLVPMIPGLAPGPQLWRHFNNQTLNGEIESWNVGKHYKEAFNPRSNVYKVSHMYSPTSTIKLECGPVNVMSLVNNRLITSSGGTLFLVDIKNGQVIQKFTDHKDVITDIYADSYRVLTCSKDYSIRVYRWNNEKLESLYQLLGGSVALKTHDGFNKIVCSAGSCVGVAGNIIKLYNFTDSFST